MCYLERKYVEQTGILAEKNKTVNPNKNRTPDRDPRAGFGGCGAIVQSER